MFHVRKYNTDPCLKTEESPIMLNTFIMNKSNVFVYFWHFLIAWWVLYGVYSAVLRNFPNKYTFSFFFSSLLMIINDPGEKWKLIYCFLFKFFFIYLFILISHSYLMLFIGFTVFISTYSKGIEFLTQIKLL